MQKQKIIVTGGCGFIGGHLVDRLVNDEYDVHVVDNFSTGQYRNENATYHYIDLISADVLKLQRICEDSISIFHLAAVARVQPSFKNPLKYHLNNATATHVLLDALSNSWFGKLIFTSSSSVYGQSTNNEMHEIDIPNPDSPYGLSKLHAEQLCKMYVDNYNMNILIARPFSVYGDRMANGNYSTVIQNFINRKRRNRQLLITGTGDQRRDFTHVEDVIDGLLLLMNNAITSGEIFNIGSNVPIFINDIANAISDNIAYTSIVNEPFYTNANIDKLKRLGYQPKHNVIDWLKNIEY